MYCLRYLTGVFILVSFHPPLNFLKSSDHSPFRFASYPLPSFTVQLPSKLTVQLEAPANPKAFAILDFCRVDFCCQLFWPLGEKDPWREEPKPSVLVPVTWSHSGSLTVFFSARFLMDTPSLPIGQTHTCSSGLHPEASFLPVRVGQLSAHHSFSVILPGLMALSALILPPSFLGL